MVKLVPGGIPAPAWIVTSLSGLVLSTGVCISAIKASDLSLEIANSKIETSNKLTKVKDLTAQLEKALVSLEEKDKAYQELRQELEDFTNSSTSKNKAIESLKPAIQKIEDTDLIELSQIRQELASTEEQASEELKDIIEQTNQESDRQLEN